MLSTPAIHQILFFLSMLFGSDTPMIGQQAVVNIQPEDRTGSITYQYVVTAEEMAHMAEAALQDVNEAVTLDRRVNFMALTGQEIRVVDDQLQVEVRFRYMDEQALFSRLGFERDEQGGVQFTLLERESLIETNGTAQEETVSWPAGVSEIHLEIAGESLSESEKEASVSLAGYWEE